MIFLYGAAKLAIWCTIKNKMEERESVDAVLMMRGFTKKRLMMEYAYYNLSNDVKSFFKQATTENRCSKGQVKHYMA